MEVIPITSEIVRSAAVFAKQLNILPHDGIHLAAVKSIDGKTIISADKEIDKSKITARLDPLLYKT